MMLVVADSSPLNVLVQMKYVGVLHQLFGRVAIPAEVAGELSRPRTPQVVKEFLVNSPDWLTVRVPKEIEQIAKLDLGERAAISLARELSADFLLIDERDGRRAAVERNLHVVGTIGVLERAAMENLLDLSAAIQGLPADFAVRIAPAILRAALERDAIRKRK